MLAKPCPALFAVPPVDGSGTPRGEIVNIDLRLWASWMTIIATCGRSHLQIILSAALYKTELGALVDFDHEAAVEETREGDSKPEHQCN
jgi:hypothetical protein